MAASATQNPVVVGVDGSDQSRQAVRWAAREARLRGVPLHLVHAWLWPLPRVPLGPPASGPAGAGLHAQAEGLLEDARREALEVAPGLPVDTALVTGDVAESLLGAAADAGLVAVGDRGLGGFSGLLLGSTGVRVTAHCACPVAIVRGESREQGPVVVGVDGSPRGEAALRLAFDEARLRGAPLVALHAWTYPVAAGVDVVWNYDSGEAEATARELLENAVADVAASHPDVPVERRLVPATAPRALVEASSDAQLLVAGCHGRGQLRALLLGSTSHALIHHAHCPVLVVHPAGSREEHSVGG